MTEITQTQIAALKDKVFSVLTVYNDRGNSDELVNILVSERIDENNIAITD